MKKVHNLKCWPVYFQATIRKMKSFEIRVDDRGFQVGDNIHLEEWDPKTKTYTGNYSDLEITYLIRLREFLEIKGWWWKLLRRFIPNIVVLGFQFQHEIEWNRGIDAYLSSLPSADLWLDQNDSARASVERGLQQASQNEGKFIGSFAEFADGELGLDSID